MQTSSFSQKNVKEKGTYRGHVFENHALFGVEGREKGREGGRTDTYRGHVFEGHALFGVGVPGSFHQV